MKKRRSFIVFVLIAVIATFSGAAAWAIFFPRLPDPETADVEGLVQWLVTRDLAAESSDVRGRLLKRMEKELREGIDLSGVDSQLAEDHRELFWTNVDSLLQDWFRKESQRYDATDVPQRSDYLNSRIDDVLAWEYVKQLRRKHASTSGGELTLVSACQQRTTAWIDNAPGEEAQKMKDFFSAATQTLFFRHLTGTLPSAG